MSYDIFILKVPVAKICKSSSVFVSVGDLENVCQGNEKPAKPDLLEEAWEVERTKYMDL